MKKILQGFFAFYVFIMGGIAHAGSLDLSAYKGKVVYVDFWASWCGPCKQSFPWMNQLQQRLSSQGLVVIGVNVDQEKKLADQFIQELKPSFKIMFDSEGTLATEYQVAGMPSAFIVDRSGKIRFKHIGFEHKKAALYEQQVVSLLNE